MNGFRVGKPREAGWRISYIFSPLSSNPAAIGRKLSDMSRDPSSS